MNTNHAMSLYFSFFAFETLRVVLTVFRRWGGAKEKVEGDSGGKGPRGGASRDSSSQRAGTLSRRGGGSNRSSSAEKKAKSSEASTSSSSSNPSGISRFFSLFDGDLRFMTGMWDRPSLCFHLGNKRIIFFCQMVDKKPTHSFFSVMSLALGVLAASTLRMKCLWAPYVCVFAGAALAHFDLWHLAVLKLGGRSSSPADRRLLVNFVRHLLLLAALGWLYAANNEGIREVSNWTNILL